MDHVKLMESMSLSENNCKPTTFYKSICAKIDQVETEIVYADHTNKLFIIVTQYQKLGSLLTVTKEQAENLDSVAEAVYTVKHLFGVENPEQLAVARFIAEKLDIQKELCLFLCLKTYSPDIARAVVDVLIDFKSGNI